MSASPSHLGGPSRPAWRPAYTALLVIAAAFALGLLLFFLLWLQQRERGDFYRAPVPPTSQSPVFAPLPAPMPAERAGASGLPEPDPNAPAAERPRLVERAPPPAAATPAPRPQPARSAVADNTPVPISSPAPRYPRSALRRRETGTVQVRVDVGPDGVPTSTSIVTSSDSRELDRAAVEAVRRWRFRPAQADGRPVAGSVVVPISFQL